MTISPVPRPDKTLDVAAKEEKHAGDRPETPAAATPSSAHPFDERGLAGGKLGHDAAPLRARQRSPAGDLGERAAAAAAQTRCRDRSRRCRRKGFPCGPLAVLGAGRSARLSPICSARAAASTTRRQLDVSCRLAASSPADAALLRAQPRRTRRARRHAFEPVRLLAERLQRRHGAQHAVAGQHDRRLGAFAQLGAQIEAAAVQLDEVLHDGEARGRRRPRRSGAPACPGRTPAAPWGSRPRECRGRCRAR